MFLNYVSHIFMSRVCCLVRLLGALLQAWELLVRTTELFKTEMYLAIVSPCVHP